MVCVISRLLEIIFLLPRDLLAPPPGWEITTFHGFYHLYIFGIKCNKENSSAFRPTYVIWSVLIHCWCERLCTLLGGYQASEHSFTHSAQHCPESLSRASFNPNRRVRGQNVFTWPAVYLAQCLKKVWNLLGKLFNNLRFICCIAATLEGEGKAIMWGPARSFQGFQSRDERMEAKGENLNGDKHEWASARLWRIESKSTIKKILSPTH